jgi:hypothetical protein
VTHQPRLRLLLLAAIILGAGCNKDESAIRTYTAPKDPPAPRIAAAEQAANDPATATGDENASPPITWTLPAGWKQVAPANALQFAAFQISPDDPKAQVTIVPLRSAAVLGNLQRWAGQLKLPEVTEADVSKYTAKTQIAGQEAYMVDMTGSAATGNPPTRLLAAIIPHEEGAWTFTLKAPQPLALAQRGKFQEFLQSIRFAPGQTAEATGPSQADQQTVAPDAANAQRYKLVKWTTPQGWQEQPGANAMRITSFRIGSEAGQAEVIVARVSQAQTGSFLDNINRWRGEVGLEPVAEQQPGVLEPSEVAGHPAIGITITGPAQGSQPPRQVKVAMDVEGPDFFFVKILGPEPIVSKQQDALKQFLASLKFEPETK